jgi:hypothetical protein
MKLAIKEVNNCDVVNIWAHSIELRRILKKEEGLYLDELYLLACIRQIGIETGKPCNIERLKVRFNILSFRRETMIQNLISKGYLNNELIGARQHYKPHKLVLTTSGEQLLIKYKKAMERLCNRS